MVHAQEATKVTQNNAPVLKAPVLQIGRTKLFKQDTRHNHVADYTIALCTTLLLPKLQYCKQQKGHKLLL
jgi:hypothetical protein